MTARIITLSDHTRPIYEEPPFDGDDFYAFLERFHGHRCPMSILGARLGLAAKRVVGRHGEDGDVRATYYHRTCALDGIAAALGTTMGNSNLKSEPDGLHLLEAYNATKRFSATVGLTDEALAIGQRYGEMRRSGSGTKEEMEALLKELENAPEELVVQHITAPEESSE
jgi:formylmethanofuran dehydrogenase subunit E